MNEATRELDESHATSTSTEKEPNAAEYEMPVAADEASRVYKALPDRPNRPNFMDFFAPRRRQPAAQGVPKYTALAEPPSDLAESLAEVPVNRESLEAPTDQSTDGKALTKAVAAKRTRHRTD